MDAEGLNLHYVTNVDVKMRGSHSELHDDDNTFKYNFC